MDCVLAAYHRPLLNEAIEAWQYGPVTPSLYHEFKAFGSGSITSKASSYEFSRQSDFSLRIHTPSIDDSPNAIENKQTKELLDFVWEAIGNLSAVQLSNLTHEAGTPWSETFARNPNKKGVDIPDDLMREWFASRTTAV